MSEMMKWGDAAMYRSAPLAEGSRAPGGGARPTVTLLNATADPLGSLAALCGIYTGKVVRSLAEVSDDDRRSALEAMQKTELNGPLEAIQFHFLIEGVTRAFTHQAVRSRFSFFAQESLRFAVVEDGSWLDRQAYPPSLAAAPVDVRPRIAEYQVGEDFERPDFMTPEERDYALRRDAWDNAIMVAQQAYQRLIDAGVPAEDARGLMPHSMTTRYHWVVSYRTLLAEAGKRLCTQAQFEWRLVMTEVVKSIREFSSDLNGTDPGTDHRDAWQFEAMADLLRPVCYAAGRCTFMADFDRNCKIRDRVEANAAIGRPSSEWGRPRLARYPGEHGNTEPMQPIVMPIHPKEWLADPDAAR